MSDQPTDKPEEQTTNVLLDQWVYGGTPEPRYGAKTALEVLREITNILTYGIEAPLQRWVDSGHASEERAAKKVEQIQAIIKGEA